MPTLNSFHNGYAFLVGVGTYKEGNSLSETVNDASILQEILTDANRCAYPKENVHSLIPHQEMYVTYTRFMDELTAFIEQVNSNPDENKTVIVYYSGHGKVFRGQYYLLPYDAARGTDTNCISAQKFTEMINKIVAKRVIVLLDCCYAGGIKSEDNLAEVLSQGKGKIIIASSTEEQTSKILAGSKYSLFTDILVKGLAGECIKHNKQEKYVRILALLSYIAAELRRYDKEQSLQINKADSLEDFPLCAFEHSYATKNPIFQFLSSILKEDTITSEDPLSIFKAELNADIEENQQNAIADILKTIKESKYSYDKVLSTSIEGQMNPLSLAMMAQQLVQSTKILIDSLR